jgi:hypothetical protein
VAGQPPWTGRVAKPRHDPHRDIDAVEADGRHSDRRMMRSCEAEDAIGAVGMVGIAGRQFHRVLGIVQTKLESRRVIANICRNGGPAKCDDQQALRSNRIGDDDADQRSQEPLGLDAQSEYAAHTNATIGPAVAALHQLMTEQTLHNAIDAKCPSAAAINV